MKKSEINAYRIYANNRQDRVYLVCVIEKIGLSGNHYGATFYELVTTFDDSTFNIPYDSKQTFQEELRTTSIAVEIIPEERDMIEKWIEMKIKEGYGKECEVLIENLATIND